MFVREIALFLVPTLVTAAWCIDDPPAAKPAAPAATTATAAPDPLVAKLEARVTTLEQIVDRYLVRPATGGDPAALAASDGGYETLVAEVHTNGRGTAEIRVNGMPVARFDAARKIDLSPFLVKGKVNGVAFRFTPRDASNAANMEAAIVATVAGAKTPIEFYAFSTDANKLEDALLVAIK